MANKETLQEISKTLAIHAPAAKIWASLTNPVLIKQWISDAAIEIYADWKPGSALAHRGNLHGIPFENKGTILQCEPEQLLAYTFWSSLSEQADIPENYSLITFRLTPENANQTILNFTQSNFITQVVYQHFNFYWTTALGLIKRLNEQPA